MSKVVRDRLKAARALVAQGWCQHAPAAVDHSRPLVDPRDPRARAWSPVGALQVVMGRAAWEGGDTPIATLRALRAVIPGQPRTKEGKPIAEPQAALCRAIADWNDAEERTHRQVLDVLEAALQSSQEEAA